MKKKSLVIISTGVVLIGLGFVLHWITSPKGILSNKKSESKELQTMVSGIPIVDADEIVEKPERFTGTIGIEGPVTDVNETKSTFALSCEDGDATVPVEYHGRLPQKGTNVIAYGEVKKTPEGKFIFAAHQVEEK